MLCMGNLAMLYLGVQSIFFAEAAKKLVTSKVWYTVWQIMLVQRIYKYII